MMTFLKKKEVEPIEPVLKNIYQSNTYRKDLSWPNVDNEPRFQEKQQVKDQQSCIFIFLALLTIPSSNRSTSQDVTTVFHTWLYSSFIEIKSSSISSIDSNITDNIFRKVINESKPSITEKRRNKAKYLT